MPLRVLFVGDSFTYFNNLPVLVQRIAESTPGEPIQTERITGSSYTLDLHWRKGRALNRIRNGHFDLVVLQENTLRLATQPQKALPAMRRFGELAKRSGARVLLLLPWAPRYSPAAQGRLGRAVRSLAHTIKAPVIPVGDAWRSWLATQPERLHALDDIHPNFRGSFLSALTIVEWLRGTTLNTAPTDFRGQIPQDKPPFIPLVDPAELPRLLSCAQAALKKRTPPQVVCPGGGAGVGDKRIRPRRLPTAARPPAARCGPESSSGTAAASA